MADTFKVRGWWLVGGPAGAFRAPHGEPEIVEAKDGKEAAHTYAARHNMPARMWWDAGAKPKLVIRVSAKGDRDP